MVLWQHGETEQLLEVPLSMVDAIPLNQEPFWNSQGEMTQVTNVTAECQNDLAVTKSRAFLTMIIDGGSYKNSINSTAIYNNRGGEMTIKGSLKW